MKFLFKLVVTLLFLPTTLFAQNLSISNIPSELTENANAVIRLNEESISIESIDKMVLKGKRIVTVLNKEGDAYLDVYKHYNNDTKISKISAKSIDANGNVVKKYSKSKFKDVSAASGLYSDDRLIYLDYTPTGYPYTIQFEYEVVSKTTGFIQSWKPVEGYAISTEKSSYKIDNPKNLTIRKKGYNFKGFDIQDKSSENTLHYLLENQHAIKYERYSLASEKILPNLSVALNQFSLKGISANITNWSEFGTWMSTNLYNNRLELSEETKAMVKGLIKDEIDPIKKARIIYDYMQNKTRYIYVGIGIGGWQPSLASDVDKLGYGDCKGLSNYTKALLDIAGVESYWTLVYAKNKKNIKKDFVSMQGNHMILNLPNNGKDIWLECTSQTTPFGFLGDFTDDRDVLVLTKNGGVIKHTPAYKNETNLQETKSTIELDTEGNLKASVEIKSKGTQYDSRFHIEKNTKEQIDKYYKSSFWKYNNNLTLNSYAFKNNKEKILFTEDLKVSIDKHATFSETNLLLRTNVFNMYNSVPKRYRNRKQALEIERGFKDIDTFVFSIPETYTFNNLLPEKTIDSKFGNYKVTYKKIDATHFQYNRSFLLKEGLYPKEDYKAYRTFIKSIAKNDNLRIALSKK